MSFDPNTPATATPVAPTTPSSPATPATPATTPQTATPSAPVSTEDRSNWVPPYRLREVTSKHEQSVAQLRAQFEAEKASLQRQLQALTGVLPPPNPEIDQVKNQFKEVFPELSEIGSQAEAIKELIALKDELRAAMQYQWSAHNRSAINSLYKAAEGVYGGPLNDDAKHQLGSYFVGYLQSNPEEYETYKSDPTVVTERFWKQHVDRFISPLQRQQVASTLNRIPGNIPQDSPSGAVPVSSPVKPQTQDERLAAALAHYKAKSTTGF